LKNNFISRLATLVPMNVWPSLCGPPLILPYYHMVSDEALPHIKPLYQYRTVRQFTDDVDFFLQHFEPIGLGDLLEHITLGKKLPSRAFLLSFDDGFREMSEMVAPILKAKGVPAMFFVNSAFVDNRELCFHQKIALIIAHLKTKPSESLDGKIKNILQASEIYGEEIIPMLHSISYTKRLVLDELQSVCGLDFKMFLVKQKPYLTSEQIRGLLSDGFGVGGHSVDHPFYGDLPLDEQLRQTRQSIGFVEKEFAVTYRAFAFPHSDTGVSQEFFERSYSDGTLQISFGTGGLLRDPWPKHFQRFSMEKSNDSPRQILSWQLARRCYRGPIHRAAISNPAAADSNFDSHRRSNAV
jgi:peptidoglycan/xylan/chitin deacetylase (PgdA/CDA1 family)